MSGSVFGKQFKVSTWGESHGKAVGVVVDGCPAGLTLDESDIQFELDRRRPGKNKYATPRSESDKVQILSGVFEGKTLGTPISMLVENKNQHSKDYSNLKDVYRPSHADFTYDAKYGLRDYRGGGRASARETIGRVAAGAVAKKILSHFGVSFMSYTKAVANIEVEDNEINLSEIEKNILRIPNANKAKDASRLLDKLIKDGNSAGGSVECIVKGIKAGLGETVFDKTDALLAKAIMSIPAVKAVEIGNGVKARENYGYDNNDNFYTEDNAIKKTSNNAGGILGGITDGSDILLRATIKAPASISKPQKTVNKSMENVEVTIEGRHDPVVVHRAGVIIEAMTALVLVDLLMQNATSTMDRLLKAYE